MNWLQRTVENSMRVIPRSSAYNDQVTKLNAAEERLNALKWQITADKKPDEIEKHDQPNS